VGALFFPFDLLNFSEEFWFCRNADRELVDKGTEMSLRSSAACVVTRIEEIV